MPTTTRSVFESFCRDLLLGALGLYVMCNAALASDDSCAVLASRKIPEGTHITVYLNDSSFMSGVYPGFVVTGKDLYFRDSTGNMAVGRTVPFAQIDHLSFRQPSPTGKLLFIGGVGVGAILGGLIGEAIAPEPEEFLDLSAIMVVGMSGMLGAIVGGYAGYSLGKNATVTVTFRCR